MAKRPDPNEYLSLGKPSSQMQRSDNFPFPVCNVSPDRKGKYPDPLVWKGLSPQPSYSKVIYDDV